MTFQSMPADQTAIPVPDETFAVSWWRGGELKGYPQRLPPSRSMGWEASAL